MRIRRRRAAWFWVAIGVFAAVLVLADRWGTPPEVEATVQEGSAPSLPIADSGP